MTSDQILREIQRCDQEIAAMEAQDPVKPAYLVCLGIEDWRRERRMLEKELGYRIDPKTGIKPIAGAWAYYSLVMNLMEAGEEPTVEDMKLMSDLDREMREFAERVKRGEA